jgi:hypothetical protein
VVTDIQRKLVAGATADPVLLPALLPAAAEKTISGQSRDRD